jgi:quinolinate synthase
MNLEEYAKLPSSELTERINRARKEKNAVILAHNYQRLEVQHIADYIGDSLELSRIAAGTDADVVVVLRRGFHGRKREDTRSEKNRSSAGQQGNLPDGAYG